MVENGFYVIDESYGKLVKSLGGEYENENPALSFAAYGIRMLTCYIGLSLQVI